MANNHTTVSDGNNKAHKWTFDTDGDGDVIRWTSTGYANFIVDSGATYGGGTLKLMQSLDGGTTWGDVGGTATTAAADSGASIWLRPCRLKPNLNGATGANIVCFLG